eukprot:gene19582-biopygen30030
MSGVRRLHAVLMNSEKPRMSGVRRVHTVSASVLQPRHVRGERHRCVPTDVRRLHAADGTAIRTWVTVLIAQRLAADIVPDGVARSHRGSGYPLRRHLPLRDAAARLRPAVRARDRRGCCHQHHLPPSTSNDKQG